MKDIEFGGLHVFGCRASCPVCGEPPEHDSVACPQCGTPHHADCWDYAGHCALYACEAVRARPASPLSRRIWNWFASLTRPTNPDRAMPFGRAIALGMAGLIGTSAVLPTFAYMRLARCIDEEVRQARLGTWRCSHAQPSLASERPAATSVAANNRRSGGGSRGRR